MRVIKVLEPKGYCSGVINAINIAKKAKSENKDQPVYLLGMLVHNEKVINELKDIGISCIQGEDKFNLLNSLPNESVVIFSAHGHDSKLDELAFQKEMVIYDATCPKVKRNMDLIKEEIAKGNEVIYIGQSHHPECDAALSISNKVSLYDTKLLNNNYLNTTDNPLVVNQTTLNMFDLKEIHKEILKRYPNARIADEICASTRLRQTSIINLPKKADLIIVVGDKASSNTNRLFDIAKTLHQNIESVMISSLDELDISILENKKYVVISSGASTSPKTIDDIFNYINSLN